MSSGSRSCPRACRRGVERTGQAAEGSFGLVHPNRVSVHHDYVAGRKLRLIRLVEGLEDAARERFEELGFLALPFRSHQPFRRPRSGLVAELDPLAGMIALGGIAGRKATERADFLNARHAEVTEQHEEATRDAETLRSDLDRLHVALTFGGAYDDPDFMDGYRVLNFWRCATVQEKRSTLEAIFSRIELAPDRMTFTYRHSIRSRVVVSLPTRRRDKETARLKAMGLGLDKEPQGTHLARWSRYGEAGGRPAAGPSPPLRPRLR